ncbi:hypothetical protein Srubr_75570 [Streptomyces rubradiris]|uniref:Uncharacterized protein n=1 Tax=Streptomyces rubradiris TaxID=285531 RepID=A0ABQ3RPB3_STRRR|nr:hypothetical protein GCM10018792_36620 [Streptomyces rubradiris]GHI57711.1 hypothetical protein Srubr_75570 [Streptomyces rubradiris]
MAGGPRGQGRDGTACGAGPSWREFLQPDGVPGGRAEPFAGRPVSHSSGTLGKELDRWAGVGRMMETPRSGKQHTKRESP